MIAACILSFCSGFLSLSLEILWIRLFSFVNHSLPQAFAFVLVFICLVSQSVRMLVKSFADLNIIYGW